MRTEKCGRCGAWRTPSQFISNNRKIKSCEICRKRSKKYEETHKEERKQYYQTNKEKVSEIKKEYYETM